MPLCLSGVSMKKKFVYILIALAVLSTAVLSATVQNNIVMAAEDKTPEEMIAEFKASYERIDSIEFTSEVDSLTATASSYFRFQPYSTTGYSLFGWADRKADNPSDIVIPSVYKGLPVVEIKPDAFMNDTNLKSVKIGSSVKIIGADAFNGCTSLESVVLGPNVKYIYQRAFRKCESLKTVDLPISLVYIAAYTFEKCSALETVNFAAPKSYVYISSKKAVEKVFGVNEISFGAFMFCQSLKSVALPDTVTKIDGGAFYHSGLESVTMSKNLTKIGDMSFESTKLTTVTIPSKVETIGLNAFLNCASLSEVVVEGTTPAALGKEAFKGVAEKFSISVPSTALRKYKAADNWSDLADYIK